MSANLELDRLVGLQGDKKFLAKGKEIRALVARLKAATMVDSTNIEPAELKERERRVMDYPHRLSAWSILRHVRTPVRKVRMQHSRRGMG